MEDRKIWIINKGNDFETCITELKQFVKFKTNQPIPLPLNIVMQLITRYSTLSICDHPEKYFNAINKFKILIVRDAGIGDLLLLEPILRQMSGDNKEITLLTRFDDVFKFNPYCIVMKMESKDGRKIDYNEYDYIEDLRSYSETAASRAEKHRTDVYNEKFKIELENKEPRIYLSQNEKNELFTKEKDKIYIGIQGDASHSFRKYERGQELIDYLISKNPDYMLVIMGDKKIIDIPQHKQIIDLREKTTIRQVMIAMKDLDYMIATDSGLMHIALTYHIPTVCIFSIIKPELRLKYYTGQYKVIARTKLECFGCGSFHMVKCQKGDKRLNPKFIAPCLDIPPQEIYEEMNTMKPIEDKRFYYCEEIQPTKKEETTKNLPAVNIISKEIKNKLWMPIIVLNEEKNLPRFIEIVMSHPVIEKVIAIDGGSNDNTVKLLQKAGAFVYEHFYDLNYHDMQAMQRNYSCSFVPDGQKIIIMDIDECFSKSLYNKLFELAESNIIYGQISRITFDYYSDIAYPEKRIKDYPDYQPRFYTWQKNFKWVGSPHHAILNVPTGIKINADIVHFEKENKDRDALERKWAEMHKKTKEVYK